MTIEVGAYLVSPEGLVALGILGIIRDQCHDAPNRPARQLIKHVLLLLLLLLLVPPRSAFYLSARRPELE